MTWTKEIAAAWQEKYDKKRRKSKKHSSIVYFVLCDGFIKIGYTTSIYYKTNSLFNNGQHHPVYGNNRLPWVHFLGAIYGDKELENRIHKLFSCLKTSHEWHLFDLDILIYVKKHNNVNLNSMETKENDIPAMYQEWVTDKNQLKLFA